jgi:hypothetical protein
VFGGKKIKERSRFAVDIIKEVRKALILIGYLKLKMAIQMNWKVLKQKN